MMEVFESKQKECFFLLEKQSATPRESWYKCLFNFYYISLYGMGEEGSRLEGDYGLIDTPRHLGFQT